MAVYAPRGRALRNGKEFSEYDMSNAHFMPDIAEEDLHAARPRCDEEGDDSDSGMEIDDDDYRTAQGTDVTSSDMEIDDDDYITNSMSQRQSKRQRRQNFTMTMQAEKAIGKERRAENKRVKRLEKRNMNAPQSLTDKVALVDLKPKPIPTARTLNRRAERRQYYGRELPQMSKGTATNKFVARKKLEGTSKSASDVIENVKIYENAQTTGWEGNRKLETSRPFKTLAECIQNNYKHLAPKPGQTIPFIDKNKAMLGLVYRKRGPEWFKVVESATQIVEKVNPYIEYEKNETNAKSVLTPGGHKHRRGNHNHLTFGISMGGGAEVPHNLDWIHADNLPAFKAIIETETFRTIFEVIDDLFHRNWKELSNYYVETLQTVRAQYPHLIPNFSKAFAAATLNMGPRTITLPHYDSANLAFGLCAIFIFGRFNGQTGGYLVIKELGIVLEVPSGCIVFIPSALVMHYNIEIQAGETRYSLTLYSAGSLFRWVYNGCKTKKALERLPLKFQNQEQRILDQKIRREFDPYAKFSTIDDIIKMYKISQETA